MIQVNHLEKSFEGFHALKGVDMHVEKGAIYGLVGPNGAGKSTLLRTINRMHDITSGTLTVDGLEVKNLKGKELRTFRRKIGMIFQSFNLVTNNSNP